MNGSQRRLDPAYGENRIKEKIDFETDRHNAAFGKPYYFSQQHELRERNNFLYKLTNDLDTDSIDVASQSQSDYTSLSYQSEFEKYYYPMPPAYEEVHKGLVEREPSEKPPQAYGFVKHNPPFEHRREIIRGCAHGLREANKRLHPKLNLQNSQNVSPKCKTIT
jgi:hypothetical protein